MRLVFGFIALQALLLAVGSALLYALGMVELRWRRLLPALGAAYLGGIALTGLCTVLLLIVGATVDALLFTAVALALGAALLVIGRIRGRPRPAVGATIGPLAIALIAVIGAFLVYQTVASADVTTAWDAAHFWSLKAATLYHHGDLKTADFARARQIFHLSHLDYPVLQPAFESIVMRFAASTSQGLVVFQLWLVLGAFVAAAAFLLRDGSRAWLALLPLGSLVASPSSFNPVIGDADTTMACFLALGTLALGLWLEERRPGLLALGVLLLGAAANIKNEGGAFAALVMIVALGAAIWTSRRSAALVAGGGVALAALIVPWRLWVHANGPFSSDITSLGTALHVGFLHDHLPVLRTTARDTVSQLLDQGVWLVPAFLVVCAICLRSGTVRRLAGFYLAAALAALVPVLWVYWTTLDPHPTTYLHNTLGRTVIGPLFLFAVALAHLLARLGPAETELRHGEEPSATPRAA